MKKRQTLFLVSLLVALMMSLRHYSHQEMMNHVWKEDASGANEISGRMNKATRRPRRLPKQQPLQPMQIIKQYRKWHSVQALQREPPQQLLKNHRRYAIGLYSCPHYAGNRLHMFLNAFLWAVVTNRTLLWKYIDLPTHNRFIGPKKTGQESSVQECERVMQRRHWIPSYDNWRRKVKSLENVTFLPMYSWYPPVVSWPRHTPFAELPVEEQVVGGADAALDDDRVVVHFYPPCFTQFPWLGGDSQHWRNQLLQTAWSRETARGLYSLGLNFLYGLLFRQAFELAPNMLSATTAANNNAILRLGIHSRHRYDKADGCNVTAEVACLRQLLLQKQQPSAEVHVYLMSDRECTLSSLQNYFRRQLTFFSSNLNVSVHVVTDHQAGSTNKAEHGPFAGVGFFQDWGFVSTFTRHGFVSSNRSSSFLVQYLVEYQVKMQAWEQGLPIPDDMPVCMLPELQAEDYKATNLAMRMAALKQQKATR